MQAACADVVIRIMLCRWIEPISCAAHRVHSAARKPGGSGDAAGQAVTGAGAPGAHGADATMKVFLNQVATWGH